MQKRNQSALNQPRSRPRFRQSKRCGWNLRRHPKAEILRDSKLQRVRSRPESLASPFWNYEVKGPRTGGDRFRATPRRNGSAIKETIAVLRRQRAALRDFYGLRTRGKLTQFTARWRKLRAREWKMFRLNDITREQRKSPLGYLEMRADVLLHRSGLMNSVSQARQALSHGHITRHVWAGVDGDGDSPRVEVARPVRRPGIQVPVGAMLSVDWDRWNGTSLSTETQSGGGGGIRDRAQSQWALWSEERARNVPRYLEVDFVRGSVVLWCVPTVAEVLRVPQRSPNPEVLRSQTPY